MKQIIKKILNEGDFDWISDIPPFIKITEPVSQKNPKNMFRVYWTTNHGGEYSVWSDDWYNLVNNSSIDEELSFFIKILQNAQSNNGYISTYNIAESFFDGETYFLTDKIKSGLSNFDVKDLADREPIIEFISEELYEKLYDVGILQYDSDGDGYATIEKWWVTYFDENGIEFNTEINRI